MTKWRFRRPASSECPYRDAVIAGVRVTLTADERRFGGWRWRATAALRGTAMELAAGEAASLSSATRAADLWLADLAPASLDAAAGPQAIGSSPIAWIRVEAGGRAYEVLDVAADAIAAAQRWANQQAAPTRS